MADWFSEGEKTNPASGTVLADTDELVAGVIQMGFMVSANANCKVVLQHRNAANTANVSSQAMFLTASAPISVMYPVPIDVSVDERIRVVTDGAISLGNVQASILTFS